MSTFTMTVKCLRGGSIPWMAPERLKADLMPSTAMGLWNDNTGVLRSVLLTNN